MKDTTILDNSKLDFTSDPGTEISKVAVTALTISATIIGIWAFASVIAGIYTSGGPVTLIRSLSFAISGN